MDNGSELVFNATATLTSDGRALEITARIPPALQIVASSYGRASWPMTLFFSKAGVPLLPWYATVNETLPWVLPAAVSDGPPVDVGLPWASDRGDAVPVA